ncbi:DUF29 family protein [Synechococcus sp. PCC 6312]|uniref:DUF29 family protein n=1 Tax=Synechococcus sp. (strain ATCC 27167 / PCC 6312) TaxID=195253 RepID=UPI003526D531
MNDSLQDSFSFKNSLNRNVRALYRTGLDLPSDESHLSRQSIPSNAPFDPER